MERSGIFSHVSDVEGRKDVIVCRRAQLQFSDTEKRKISGSPHFSLACFTRSVPQAACAGEPGYEAIVTGQFKLNVAVDIE